MRNISIFTTINSHISDLIRWFVLLASIILIPLATYASTFPNTINSVSELKNLGWEILDIQKGDLNKDKRKDLVVVLEQETDISGYKDKKRIMLVYFKTSDNKFKKSVENKKIILCAKCGGIKGDPYGGVRIDRGSLVITNAGGSRYLWEYNHRYRHQNGDWYLIGLTESSQDNILGTGTTTDTNLITGDQIITKYTQDKDTKIKGKKKIKSLPKLSKWDWDHPVTFVTN